MTTLEETIESFGLAKQASYTSNLAALVGVNASRISLSISPGSIRVVAKIEVPNDDAAAAAAIVDAVEAITDLPNATAVLSAALNTTVKAVRDPEMVVVIGGLPPSNPPPTPPPVPAGPARIVSVVGREITLALGILSSLVIVCSCFFVAYCFHRQRKRHAKRRARAKIGGPGMLARRDTISGTHGPLVNVTGGGGGGGAIGAMGATYDGTNYDIFKSLGAVQSLSATYGVRPLQAQNLPPPAAAPAAGCSSLVRTFTGRAGAGGASPAAESTTEMAGSRVGAGASCRSSDRGGRSTTLGGTSAYDTKAVPWSEIKTKDKLGEGAFGEVYAVEYAHTRCALKKLHAGSGTLVDNLKAECDVMMQLRHPHVLQLIGFASDGEAAHGILMELMEANLNDILYNPAFAEYNAWDRSLLAVATDVSRGMAYLHMQSVLHCDIKPANILISAQWIGKVADFGHSWEISKAAGVIGGGELHGTPPYMAPEVVLHSAYLPPVDVWSFGCVLAHMATRKPPYSGLGLTTVSGVLQTVASGTASPAAHIDHPPRDGEAPLAVPPQIRQLALDCTARDPGSRPTFDGVADRLTSASLIGEVLGTTPRSTDIEATRPIGRLRRGAAPQAGTPGWAKIRSIQKDAAAAKVPPAAAFGGGGGGGGGGVVAAAAAAAAMRTAVPVRRRPWWRVRRRRSRDAWPRGATLL